MNKYNEISFNPCFNGSSSYTIQEEGDNRMWSYGFNPCFNGSSSYTRPT